MPKPNHDGAYAAAYCNGERFPLTTQKGLSPKDQKLIDAVNMDGHSCHPRRYETII